MIGSRRTAPALVVLVATVLTTSACSSGEELAVVATEPSIETTSETATTAPSETTTETTATAPTAETTTTSPPATTAIETTTTVEETGSTTEPAPVAPAVAYLVIDQDLVEVDPTTSATGRTVTEYFNGDGVFRGGLRVSPDGTTMWFSEGYEDGWYDCEASVGSVGVVDLVSGSLEIVGLGQGVDPSPDGRRIAYLTSGVCVPDPENPELFVLTPYDRVVIRELASGAERQIVSNPAPTDYASPSFVWWVGFAPSGDLVVVTGDGQVRLVDPDGSDVLQDHPVVVPMLRGEPVGTTAAGVVTVDIGDEGSADVYVTDLESGEARLLATSEGYVVAAVAASGAVLAFGFTSIDVEPGAPVTVLAVPDDVNVYSLDW